MFPIFIAFMLVTQRMHYVCSATNEVEKEMQMMFHRKDLRCPNNCNRHNTPKVQNMQCCVCKSSSMIKYELGILGLKYLNNRSGTQLIHEDGLHRYYGLSNRNGNLTELPINICEFGESLFQIDLSYNKIRNLTGISCLQKLDTLILRGNNIREINNQEILRLPFIRILDLSYNKITYIDPGLILNVDGSLFNFNLSYNEIQSMDITNSLMSKQPYFCILDYTHNKIQQIVNIENWICKENTSLGHGGKIDLSNNFMIEFFDAKKFNYLGFSHVSLFGKVFDYALDLRDNKWNCDCKVYPFAYLAKFFVSMMERDYFLIKCFTPLKLRNQIVVDLIKRDKLDVFTCEIPMAGKCPARCQCTYQPAIRNRTIVNCSRAGYRTLPKVLPNYQSLEVDFSDNNFISFPTHTGTIDYLQRITVFNMTKNKIQHISDTDFYPLKNASIDLRDNQIIGIPRSFQVLNPCNIYLYFIKDCECSDKWLQEWLPRLDGRCARRVQVLCNMRDGIKPIQILTSVDLGCVIPDDNLPVISNCVIIAFLSIAVVATISYSFRYEFFIIVRETMKYLKSRPGDTDYLYDSYIACNEDDSIIRQWIISVLLPFLLKSNLNVFFPCLHSRIGAIREEEMIDVMSKCRSIVIILSAHYNSPLNWHEMEWKHAWHNWARDFNRELVIVNYDMVTSGEVSSKNIGAFLRLGMFIDFSNHKKSIEKDIKNRISINDNESRFSRDYSNFDDKEEREMDEMSPLLNYGVIFPSYNEQDTYE